MSPDAIVIGGGVIGSAVAYQLSRHGVRVVVFDPGTAGQASAASAGVLAPQTEALGPAIQDLQLESARLYGALSEELRDATGIDPGYRPTSALFPARTEADELALRHRREHLDRLGVAATWLDARQARDVEPALGHGIRAALHFSDVHQVDVRALVLGLRRAAVDLGARIRPDAVDALDLQGERVVGVLVGGERVAAPEVIIAAGAWTGAFGPDLHLSIPVRPVRGQMVALQPAGSLLHAILFAPDVYVLRKAGGWIYVGATVEEAGYDAQPTAGAVRDLLAAAVGLVPLLTNTQFLHAGAGLRPATPDGLPLIGRVPGIMGLSIAAGHFREGVLLAPITAELIADLVQHRRPRFALDAFDPTRFTVRAA